MRQKDVLQPVMDLLRLARERFELLKHQLQLGARIAGRVDLPCHLVPVVALPEELGEAVPEALHLLAAGQGSGG